MVSLSTARDNPEKLLWDEIDGIHAGMLGIDGTHELQPMGPNVDLATKSIWFFAKKSSDFVRAIRPAAAGTFVVIGDDHDFHAVLRGSIEVDPDPRRVEEYWSSMVEAWFEHGKNDPDLTLIHFRPAECRLWAQTGNLLKLGWEVAKANLDPDKTPDVGVYRRIAFV